MTKTRNVAKKKKRPSDEGLHTLSEMCLASLQSLGKAPFHTQKKRKING